MEVAAQTWSEDVLRRAHIFDAIAELIQGWPLVASAPCAEGSLSYQTPLVQPAPSVPSYAPSLLPYVAVIDQQLACNTALYDLQHRPLMLRLFRSFCEAKDYQLSREQILAQVYMIPRLEERTERYLESKHGNAVKLISRARILASAAFGRTLSHGIEWFVYDQERKTWCLFRLRNEYVARRSLT